MFSPGIAFITINLEEGLQNIRMPRRCLKTLSTIFCNNNLFKMCIIFLQRCKLNCVKLIQIKTLALNCLGNCILKAPFTPEILLFYLRYLTQGKLVDCI